MTYYGDFAPGAVIDVTFNTADYPGAPITLGGTPAIDIYKGNGAIPTTAGVTLAVDYASVLGLHHVRIDTGADAFYGSGDYRVVISSGTVDGVSVIGRVVATFSLSARVAGALATQAKADVNAELIAALNANDEVAAIKAKTDLIPGDIDGYTYEEVVKLVAAVLLGKASGLNTSQAVFRALDDSKNRITAEVDGHGNRSTVTRDTT